MVTPAGIELDMRLVHYLNTGLEILDPAAVFAGLMLGMEVAFTHPEWAQAFRLMTGTPSARNTGDELVRLVPIEIVQ